MQGTAHSAERNRWDHASCTAEMEGSDGKVQQTPADQMVPAAEGLHSLQCIERVRRNQHIPDQVGVGWLGDSLHASQSVSCTCLPAFTCPHTSGPRPREPPLPATL